MVTIYEKFRALPMNLVETEAWCEGETKELPRVFHGEIYFNPLFTYKPDDGVTVYYPRETQQNEFSVAKWRAYVTAHPDEFDTWEKAYLRIVEKIKQVQSGEISPDIKTMYDWEVKMWPIQCSIGLFKPKTAEEAETTKDPLSLRMHALRLNTERVIYELSEVLLKAMYKQMSGYSKEDVHLMLLKEILDPKLVDAKAIQERKRGYVYFNGRFYVVTSAEEVLSKLDIAISEEKIDERINEFKGTVGNNGVVRGSVRIIKSFGQFSSFREGEVLVAPMTTPDYLPLMRKAAAFVTDEGGLTCHAAIAAREMKKPCVVGTKVATQVLKDGDLVEVDADRGVVRILERA